MQYQIWVQALTIDFPEYSDLLSFVILRTTIPHVNMRTMLPLRQNQYPQLQTRKRNGLSWPLETVIS